MSKVFIYFCVGVTILIAEKEEAQGATPAEQVIWTREIAVGYNSTAGNTRQSQLYADILINRNNKHVDEWTLKATSFYSSENRKMNSQKWYTLGRYAFSLGAKKNLYNFYRMEADHDRFANINYRLVPVGGIGYWLYDLADIKIMAEMGTGAEYTNFKDDTKNRTDWILAPRAFFEKRLFGDARIIENLYYYPIFKDFSDYRFRSDTVLDVPLNKKFSLRLSVIDEYNSKPSKDTKKNDLRLISSMAYSF